MKYGKSRKTKKKEKLMYLSDERFFCEELDTSIPELSDIGDTFKNKGLDAAEKQLCGYLRKVLPGIAERYFKIPYYRNGEGGAYTLPGESDKAIADRVLEGDVISCGTRHKFEGGRIIWEANPTYNEYREWTWQLSRHRSWRIIGKVYRDTGDEKYAEGFVRHLLSWIEQVPCPEDASGYSTKCWRTIETGIRMTEIWHYAFLACYTSPTFTDHVMTVYMKSIWEHANRLRTRYTEGNWLFMEMSGLAHIAILYPWFKSTKAWREQALGTLTSEVSRQMLPDGFQLELSSTYHGVVLDNLVRPLKALQAMEGAVPKDLAEAMMKLCDVYVKLCAPDMRIPALHDGVRSGFYGYLVQALQYKENPVYRYLTTDRKEGHKPDFTDIALPYSGMAVMRSSWEADGVWFFFDSGPFGFGTMGHQHEDKLNVLMYAYGKDVLSDPGKYEYDGSDMFHFIKDTRSHNCAMVDALSQNRRGIYKYKDNDPALKQPSDLRWSFTEDYGTAEGAYEDGFGNDFTDVTQKRKVIFFRKGLNGTLPFSLVIDRFIPNDGKEHRFAVSYQMNTNPYTSDGKIFTADFGDGVTMNILGSSDHEIVIAQKEPYFIGWRPIFAQGEHEHAPAPCVRFPYFGKEQRIITVLYPSNNGKVGIKSVECKNDVSDTVFTLTLENGEKITLDEKAFPTSENADISFNAEA